MCYIFDVADTHFGGNEMGLRSAVLRLLDSNQHIYMYIYMYIEGVVHGVLFEHGTCIETKRWKLSLPGVYSTDCYPGNR